MRTKLAATAVLLAVSLAACGGGSEEPGSDPDDAPQDATTADFCGVWLDEDGDDPAVAATASPEEQADAVVAVYETDSAALAEVGTPADIPADAREGYEKLLDAATHLDRDEIARSIEDGQVDYLGTVLDDDETDLVQLFTDWADDYCG